MPFNLVICEIHNKDLHGYNEESDPNIKGHYLCAYRMNDSLFDKIDEDDDENPHIYEMVQFYRTCYHVNPYVNHDFIRNYKNIISNINYIKPEIAQVVELSGGELVAILKTFWLKIIQRAWKKVFQKRMEILAVRKSLYAIRYKEVNGKYPSNCRDFPSLTGLLVR
jgi:hypothetical protein